MKSDQVVRSVAAICAVTLYGLYLGLNGSGPIHTGIGVGTVHPFAGVLLALIILALPETLDRLPMGPSSKK